MKFYRARWVPVAWLDALLKRIFDLAVAIAVTFLSIWLLSLVLGPEDGPRKSVLYIVIVLAIWIIVASVRLIVHPIRAAVSGKFLDEYAAQKAAKAEAAKAAIASPATAAIDSTRLYKGVDPVPTGRSLKDRVHDVWTFSVHSQRLPALDAPRGSDQYFFNETLTSLARSVNSGVETPEEKKLAKLMDSVDKNWRQVYGGAL